MAGDGGGVDPRELARAAGSAVDPHALLGLAALGAVVLRLATYTGTPRGWRAVLLDGVVQFLVALAVAEGVHGLTGSAQQAMAAGLLCGLVGWEAVKRIAAQRAEGKEKGES